MLEIYQLIKIGMMSIVQSGLYDINVIIPLFYHVHYIIYGL